MFRAATSPPHLATLILLMAGSVLTLNMYLPSLANIAAELDTSYALVSLSVSGFLAVNAVLQLIIGPIADRYGRRPVLLVCLSLFLVGSVVCALAQSIWVFLAARVIQSAVIAASTLSSAIISDTTEKDQAASRMGYLSMAMAVAPMLAPMLGGVFDQFWGWRSGFWFYTLLGVGLICLTWLDLGESNPKPADTFKEQLRAYPELFRSRRFWGYAITMSFGVGAFFLFVSAAPFVAGEVFGLTPSQVGMGIGSITGGFFLGSFLSGRYAARMGVLWMIFAGRIVALVGVSLALVLTLAGLSHPWVFFGGAISVGVGNGLTVPSARAGALAIRPHLAGSASGLSGSLIVAFGAVLTLLPGLLLTADNADAVTLILLLLCKIGGFLSAGLVWWVDRSEARLTAKER